jgi:hypothetical protein
MKASLIINSNHRTRKSKAKTQCVHDLNVKAFYSKNITRTEQDHDKNMYPELMLNILKIMWDSTSISYERTPRCWQS